jgi:hypothetical protein
MPLPGYFVFTAVLFGVLTYGVRRATDPSHVEPWWTSVMGAALFGLLMTWFVARRRRGFGGTDQMVTVAQALKSNRLPPDVDLEAWSAALDRQERTARRLRRWGPIEFAAFSLLEGAVALTHHSAWWWIFLTFFVGMFWVSLVAPPRQLRRIERLRGQLEERSVASG